MVDSLKKRHGLSNRKIHSTRPGARCYPASDGGARRELWAPAYGNKRQVHGTRKVQRDSLNHREIMAIWYIIKSTPKDMLIQEGGPMGGVSTGGGAF